MNRDLDHVIAVAFKRAAWAVLLVVLSGIGGCSVLVYAIAAKVAA